MYTDLFVVSENSLRFCTLMYLNVGTTSVHKSIFDLPLDNDADLMYTGVHQRSLLPDNCCSLMYIKKKR